MFTLPVGALARGLHFHSFKTLASWALLAIACSPAASRDDAFATWSRIASAETVSPVQPQPGDEQRIWRAPDGREIRLVVRKPNPRAEAPTVVLPAFPSDEDAGPHFEAAVARTRLLQAGRLVIPKGRYVFRNVNSTGVPAPIKGHLLLQGLDDLTIDGQGSTLVFTRDDHGVVVRGSRRLKLTGLTLDYSLRTASLGTVQREGNLSSIKLDPAFPVTAADSVYYAMQLDPATGLWRQGGPRAIMPPGSKTPAVHTAAQTYTSRSFNQLTPGQPVLVLHHWYGGAAIRIDDTRHPRQAEDITIEDVTIHAAPGMGIVAYGLKRGLAVLGSRIVPRPDGSSPISTSYDAMHVILSGGDILFTGNRIAGQTDDGINISSAVHPVLRIEDDPAVLVLGKYSRFINAGDMLALFDGQGRYLGQRRVTSQPVPLGGLDHKVVLDSSVPGLQLGGAARDLALTGSRYVVADNIIERCYCHGVLAQLPNGLIERNTIRDISHNAIRLLTDVGTWYEGVGAINVVLRGNTITRNGFDVANTLPWAAISAYGGARGGKVAESAVNAHLEISDNTIDGAQQACITVASSQSVVVRDNRCNDTNLRAPGRPSIHVMHSSGVKLVGNQRSGSSTGGITTGLSSDGKDNGQPQY